MDFNTPPLVFVVVVFSVKAKFEKSNPFSYLSICRNNMKENGSLSIFVFPPQMDKLESILRHPFFLPFFLSFLFVLKMVILLINRFPSLSAFEQTN